MRRLLPLFAAFVVTSQAVAQKVFSSPEHHFRLSYVSTQWTEVPDIAANANASRPADRVDDVRFVTGFVPSMHRKGSETHVVLQFIRGDLDRVRYDDVRAYFDAEGVGTTAEGSFAAQVKAPSIPGPVLDRELNAVVFDRSFGTGPDDTMSRTAAYLTRDGILEVQCYAKREHFSKDLEKFLPILTGIKVDADARFVAGEKRLRRKGSGDSSFSMGNRYVLGGGIGGLGLVGLLVRLLMPRGDR